MDLGDRIETIGNGLWEQEMEGKTSFNDTTETMFSFSFLSFVFCFWSERYHTTQSEGRSGVL